MSTRFVPQPAKLLDHYDPTAHEWESDLLDLWRRLLKALAFLVLTFTMGVVGFSVIDPQPGFVRAFYMTAITLTTVGFGEEIAIDSDGTRSRA